MRIQIGESLGVGPEKTGRPDYRWHIHGGIQIGNEVYLLASDIAHSSQAAILKMLPVNHNTAEYTYHELVRLGTTEDGGFIGATSIPTPSGAPAIICSVGGKIFYIKLGRGGGRHIDDANYSFGLAYELETGLFSPTNDMSMVNMLVGADIISDQDNSETLSVTYGINGATPSTNMLNEQESGSGTAAITNTSGYTKTRRYAAIDATGQFFELKLSGSMANAASGSDRPEIRELWAFGYSHPSLTDIISVNIFGSEFSMSNGIKQGNSVGEIERLFRDWMNEGTTLTVEIPDYEEARTTRFSVVGVTSSTGEITRRGNNSEREGLLTIQLMRLDYANAYAD